MVISSDNGAVVSILACIHATKVAELQLVLMWSSPGRRKGCETNPTWLADSTQELCSSAVNGSPYCVEKDNREALLWWSVMSQSDFLKVVGCKVRAPDLKSDGLDFAHDHLSIASQQVIKFLSSVLMEIASGYFKTPRSGSKEIPVSVASMSTISSSRAAISLFFVILAAVLRAIDA